MALPRDTKIILVEGMPGTGKSTVSQLIHRQLRASGQPSDWCHEERAAHPVRLFYDRDRHASWTAYCADAMQLWQSYVQTLQAENRIAVVDAAVLQNHARTMLLFGCDWNRILELVREIESLLAPVQPVWIYLKPTDVERHFRDVIEVRGQRLLDLWLHHQQQFPYASKARAAGFAGFVEFWQEFSELADRVFDELTIAKMRQMVPQPDEDIGRRLLLDFLALGLAESPLALEIDHFAGEYRAIDDPSAAPLGLQVKGGCLTMICDDPNIDVQQGPAGCYLAARLIPIARNRFYVEAWPHEVAFTQDASGTVVGMELRALEGGWGPALRVYSRANGITTLPGTTSRPTWRP